MKKEIIKIWGESNTATAVFKNENLEAKAIYTFEGDVFCLKDGWDFPFDELSEDAQRDILNEMKSKNYEIDDTFQG